MSKAYDRVEWGFVVAMMRKLGLNERWIHLIYHCMSTVRYRVVINGNVSKPFAPGRGLRQGDPLSPYLFLFCSEGLSASLSKLKNDNHLKGVKACRRGPSITHLFFADDSFLFFRANAVECDIVKNLLKLYEEKSGQMVNFDKSGLFFSLNTDSCKASVKNTFGIQDVSNPEKYLGLPSIVGKCKRRAFHSIIEKIRKRISTWNKRWLSQAGKEVFIKAVLQAIPSYTMSVFLLPQTLCEEIDKIIRSYWWSKDGFKKGMAWIRWQTMCKGKWDGGLGFRSMECFNKALIGKQIWRLMKNEDSLVYKVFKAKYFPAGDILEAKIGSRPSLIWRGICVCKENLKEGMMWRVGNGEKIVAWGDCWIPNLQWHKPMGPVTLEERNRRVRDFIDQRTGQWSENNLKEAFTEAEVKEIIKILPSRTRKEDRLVWKRTNDGCYSVKSGYHFFLQHLNEATDECTNKSLHDPQQGKFWKLLWRTNVSPKVRMFAWRSCHEILPVMSNLVKRKLANSPLCPRCREEDETVLHVLLNCKYANDVWRRWQAIPMCLRRNFQTAKEWFLSAMREMEPLIFKEALVILWGLLNWRNKEILGEKRKLLGMFLIRQSQCKKSIKKHKPNPTQLNQRGSVIGKHLLKVFLK